MSPLEIIGDSIPENNYDYAQAGRLYASFRKKRRSRNNVQYDAGPGPSAYSGDHEYEQYQEEELEGAVGLDPSAYPEFADSDDAAIEHNFGYDDVGRHDLPQHSRRKYQNTNSSGDNSTFHYQNVSQAGSPQNHNKDFGAGTRQQPVSSTYNTQAPSIQSKSERSESQPDKYGHINVNVEIRSNPPSHHYQTQIPSHATRSSKPDTRSYENVNPSADIYPYPAPFYKQGSDRSSRSTNADSGYCPDGDGDHSRGGSYDNSEQNYNPKHKHGWREYENFPQRSYEHDTNGLENPAFSYEDRGLDSGLRKHKELASQVMKEQTGRSKTNRTVGSHSDHHLNYSSEGSLSPHTSYTKDFVEDVVKAPPRHKKIAVGFTDAPKVAESFI